MKYTKEGQSAFDNNECPHCNCFVENEDDTECPKCNKPLPRPTVEFLGWGVQVVEKNKENTLVCSCGHSYTKGEFSNQRRLIKGFKTSYRRLVYDKPASTITMNSGVISSDMKGHPKQNRVLSIREILRLSTLDDYPNQKFKWSGKYSWKSEKEDGEWYHGGKMSPRLIRQVIGESIPPLAMQRIVEHLMDLDPRIP